MFVHRKIRVTVRDGDNGGTLHKYEGLRVLARIQKAGGAFMGTAEIIVFGLSLADISELSTYGTQYRPTQHYEIVVEAGDDRNGMSVVFMGYVYQAWADFTGMPEVPMHFLAMGTSPVANVGTIQPTSWSGPRPVASILQPIAAAGGWPLENNGVKAVLDSGYHWGSPWKQMKEIADASNINIFQEDGKTAIWNKDGVREGETLEVSRKTGMRDYPSFTQYGVLVKVEFSKAIKYGTLMNITSDLKRAEGPWQIIQIDYDLASELPNGNWFAVLSGAKQGAPVTGLFKS